MEGFSEGRPEAPPPTWNIENESIDSELIRNELGRSKIFLASSPNQDMVGLHDRLFHAGL